MHELLLAAPWHFSTRGFVQPTTIVFTARLGLLTEFEYNEIPRFDRPQPYADLYNQESKRKRPPGPVAQ
jgi:hypothetical protein